MKESLNRPRLRAAGALAGLAGFAVFWAVATWMALPASARGAEEETPKERHKRIEGELNRAITEWQKEMREQAERGSEEGGERKAIPMMPPIGDQVAAFAAGASDYAGTEDAVPFLQSVARYGFAVDAEKTAGAIQTLVDDHHGSTGWLETVEMLPQLGQVLGAERVDAWIAELEADAESVVVRGFATLARLGPVLEDSSVAVDSEAYRDAKTKLLEVAKAAENDALRTRIEGLIAGREQLTVGGTAPDIVGEDLDGVSFRLSDYRGKVVLLDFWGDW